MKKRQLQVAHDLLTQYINKAVLTERMAYNREQFIDNLEHYLLGAIGEFYKARLAEKIFENRNQDVNHWYKEVNTLLHGFEQMYLHEIRGFKDKEKAFNVAKVWIDSMDDERKKRAFKAMRDDFGFNEFAHDITAQDNADFWAIVGNLLDDKPIEPYLLGMKL